MLLVNFINIDLLHFTYVDGTISLFLVTTIQSLGNFLLQNLVSYLYSLRLIIYCVKMLTQPKYSFSTLGYNVRANHLREKYNTTLVTQLRSKTFRLVFLSTSLSGSYTTTYKFLACGLQLLWVMFVEIMRTIDLALQYMSGITIDPINDKIEIFTAI